MDKHLRSSLHDNQEGKGRRNGMGEKREEEEEKEKEEEEIYCGLGQCRPTFLQACADIKCVTVALCLAGTSTSTLSIYINSQITTLERQFGFSSSVSGFLLSCNDFGYLLTTLFMSYLARRVHILRALSLSTLLFGLSGLVCTLPFLASLPDLPPVALLAGSGAAGDVSGGPDRAASGGNTSGVMNFTGPFGEYLCRSPVASSSSADSLGANSSEVPGNACGSQEQQRSSAISEDKKWLAVCFIGIGMVFQGFGKSPRQPFISTYIDDNVPKTKTTLYLGIVTTCSIFGPVLAFTLGGLFSKMYLTLEETTMSPRDPRWVGAWWLGFLLFGSMGILASIPTLFLPRRLRPQPHLRQLEAARKRAAKGRNCCHEIKEFFKTILRLVRNPVYVCMVAGTCSVLFGISGMVAFMPKYLETQFTIPAWKANIILGIVNILSAAGGTLIGGIVTSRLKMSPLGCLKMIISCSVISAMFITTGFFLGCDQPAISMGHSTGTKLKEPNEGLAMACGVNCQCDDTRFFPTCGQDGVIYFSPCHAGCAESQGMSFRRCSCVNFTMTSDPQTTSSFVDDRRGADGATPGFCATDCDMLYPYAITNFLGAFTATLIIMPSFIVSVRSVSDSDKPLSIGLSAFMSSLLGWFLGPIMFGRIADTCCLLWSSGCDGSGSCSLYNLITFRYRFHTAFLTSRVVGSLFYMLALLIVLLKHVQFAPHQEHDVIDDTLPAEAERLMLETQGTAQKRMTRDGDPDDDFRFTGGEKIYKRNNSNV